MKIKEMNEDSRPRERLLKFGIENLSDAEILAIMLRAGTREKRMMMEIIFTQGISAVFIWGESLLWLGGF